MSETFDNNESEKKSLQDKQEFCYFAGGIFAAFVATISLPVLITFSAGKAIVVTAMSVFSFIAYQAGEGYCSCVMHLKECSDYKISAGNENEHKNLRGDVDSYYGSDAGLF